MICIGNVGKCFDPPNKRFPINEEVSFQPNRRRFDSNLLEFNLCYFLFDLLDGMTDCSDSECCSHPICSEHIMCLASNDPVEVLLRKQPPSVTASFYQRTKFLIEENSVQSYAHMDEYSERWVISDFHVWTGIKIVAVDFIFWICWFLLILFCVDNFGFYLKYLTETERNTQI